MSNQDTIRQIIEYIDASGVLPSTRSKNTLEKQLGKILEKNKTKKKYKTRRETYWRQRLQEAKNHIRMLKNGKNPENKSIERWIKRQKKLRQSESGIMRNKEIRQAWDKLHI